MQMKLPTQKQVEAGREIANEIYNISMINALAGPTDDPFLTLPIYLKSQYREIIDLYERGVIDSVGAIYLAMQQVEEQPVSPYKPHEQRELINAVCAIARGFHSHESLRDRIAHVLVPAFAAEVVSPKDAGQQEQVSSKRRKP